MNQKSVLLARKELARAKKSLRAAEMLLEHELYEDAVSRAYYAVLRASKAALASLDIFPVTHQSVRRLFGFHLVKVQIIEREYATILTAEQEDRELSDYDITIVIGKERASQRVNDARRFVSRIEDYLSKIESGNKDP
jgi:uncharacterized protein (UPF0332 family)